MEEVAHIKYCFQAEYKIRKAFSLGYRDGVISFINPIIASVGKWTHSFRKDFPLLFPKWLVCLFCLRPLKQKVLRPLQTTESKQCLCNRYLQINNIKLEPAPYCAENEFLKKCFQSWYILVYIKCGRCKLNNMCMGDSQGSSNRPPLSMVMIILLWRQEDLDRTPPWWSHLPIMLTMGRQVT